MKSSLYNLYFPLKDKYIVYNTLKDSLLVVDEDLKILLETADLESIDEKTAQSLLKCGITLPDNLDEKALLRFSYLKAKYSPDYISVLLLPTYACNLSCHYCPNPSRPIMMTPETAHSVAHFLKTVMQSTRYGVILKLYGGEPLLNADCCTILCQELSSFCHKNNLPFLAAAMTNGTLLTHKKTESLLPYLGAVHITMDGFKPYHDGIRYYSHGGGTYDDILEGLTLLRERNIRTSVRINATLENLDSIRELLEDLKKHEFDEYNKFEIYFGPIAPLEECKYFKDDKASQEFKDDTFNLIPKLREIVKSSQWKGSIRDMVLDLKGVPKPELCQYEKSYYYVIDPEGSFFTCPGFCGNTDYCIGTLKKGIPEFASLYYDIHTRDVMQGECLDCQYMPVCGGGCPARAYIRTGKFDSVFCGSVKELTKVRTLSYLHVIRPDLFSESG